MPKNKKAKLETAAMRKERIALSKTTMTRVVPSKKNPPYKRNKKVLLNEQDF